MSPKLRMLQGALMSATYGKVYFAVTKLSAGLAEGHYWDYSR